VEVMRNEICLLSRSDTLRGYGSGGDHRVQRQPGILLQGALDALERTVQFVERPL
jgi:hypothetical protein